MFIGPLRRARNGLLTEQEWSEPPVALRRYSKHPPAAPVLVRRDRTVQLCSCVLPRRVRSIGTLPEHRMSCGRPTDQNLFEGYIRGVRVTASWGATWIPAGNHLRAYFDLRVVVWLPVEGLGLPVEAARLPGQAHQSQSRATPSTEPLLWVISGL